MSLNEEFDELARRKLEGRQFPFQEADWQDARKRIDAQRSGRDRAAWIIGAGLLLLISGLAWYGTRPSTSVSSSASVGQQQIDGPQQVPAASGSAIAMNTAIQSPPSSAAASTNAVNDRSATELTTYTEARPSAAQGTEAAPRTGSVSIPPMTAPETSVRVEHSEAKPAAPAPAKITGVASVETNAPPTLNDGGQTTSTGSLDERPIFAASGNNARHDGGSPEVSASTAGDRQTAPAGTQDVVNGVQPPADQGITNGPGVMPPTPQTERKDDPSLEEATTGAQDPTALSGSSTTGSNEPTNTGAPALGDSASASQGSPDTGSADAAPPAPEAAPPLVPDRAPWEISVLGGVFTSHTVYSGSNSADWTGNIKSARSINVGAEFMHMGRNIGIGAGLHYGSYAERLRADAIDVTNTTTENFWYLLPVDTTFLFITDTVPGQPPSYTGTSVDTTVNVLTPGTNTVTSTEHLREARDQVNRVSYLEVPLLLDAHLVQGRWSFGLRGGPTFGLLTGRRGSIPSVDNEGYVAFSDLPFHEFVLGYTARAYFRYRFNAAWSVGVEPAIRGQLMNSLGSGDLVRRASAKGVLISLSYRLR